MELKTVQATEMPRSYQPEFIDVNRWSETINTGAGSRIRTDDLLITNQLLYQLSYAGFNEI